MKSRDASRGEQPAGPEPTSLPLGLSETEESWAQAARETARNAFAAASERGERNGVGTCGSVSGHCERKGRPTLETITWL